MDETNKDSISSGELIDESSDAKAETKSCPHYTRKCKLKAACCSEFFPCRFCHDDSVMGHEMDRYAVQEIQCMNCDSVQPVSNGCSQCGVKFGEYFCEKCRLFDADKQQFHCDKCGLCRIGPKESFFHCDTCNACLSQPLGGNHKCVENVSKNFCPICYEFLHTSREALRVPKCGHMIHSKCLKSFYEQGMYQCPICKVSLTDMSSVWEEMDLACASVMLPEDLRNLKLNILCQDCHKENSVPYNTEGLKCPDCGGYNTTQA